MGHIVNPNMYRLGKMFPWVSSGFKRHKNERNQVANEDFLIYNFTRNFFYKKVYKKVIGKIARVKLKVRRKRVVRKNKRKRKFGKTSLLNHWIIKYSHLSITRFNKTFQLNLFFFDRELQKKYRLRNRRGLGSTRRHYRIKNYKKKRKLKFLQTQLKIKRRKNLILKQGKKLKSRRRIKRLTTKVHFNGIAQDFRMKNKKKVIVPSLQVLSKDLAFDVETLIKKPRLDTVNYSVAREFRKLGDFREKVYIYKDNTFEGNKIKNRLENMSMDQTSNYQNMFFSKTTHNLFYYPRYKTYKTNYFLPKEYTYIDSLFFKNKASRANKYLYSKGNLDTINKGTGIIFNKLGYNDKQYYLDVIRKKNTKNISLLTKYTKDLKNIINIRRVKKFEENIEKLKFKDSHKNRINRKDIIKTLKQKEIWKKHYIRLKVKQKRARVARRQRQIQIRHQTALHFEKNINNIK